MNAITRSYNVEVPIALVKEYAYCPRVAFYMYFTMHEPPTKSMEYPSYTKLYLARVLRRHGVEGDIYMECPVRSSSLGVYGKIDAVVMDEGRVSVVEVKLSTSRAKLREKAFHYLIQLTTYAIACEETFKRSVREAMIVVLSTDAVVKVDVTPRLRKVAIDTINEFKEHIREERLPPRTPKRARCHHCFYSKLCPDWPGRGLGAQTPLAHEHPRQWG